MHVFVASQHGWLKQSPSAPTIQQASPVATQVTTEELFRAEKERLIILIPSQLKMFGFDVGVHHPFGSQQGLMGLGTVMSKQSSPLAWQESKTKMHLRRNI